jgi:hypothetical protein
MTRSRKPRSVKITNPAKSRLPSKLGEFAPRPAKPDPITPKARGRVGEQIKPSDTVKITNRRASR